MNELTQQLETVLRNRANLGLCSITQVRLLVSKGVPPEIARRAHPEDIDSLISKHSRGQR